MVPKNLDSRRVLCPSTKGAECKTRLESRTNLQGLTPCHVSLGFQVLPGNHEIEVDADNAEAFMAYRTRFRMPGEGSESTLNIQQGRPKNYGYDLKYSGGSSYYSMEIGLMHILCLNTYDTHSYILSKNASARGERPFKSPQQLFVEKDLNSIDREKTPFVLVFMHGPFHNHNEKHRHEDATTWMQSWAEPLFYIHRVNIVFAGHVHA